MRPSAVKFLCTSVLLLLLRPNAKWPFALSNNHLFTGGWARQQNGELFRAMPVRRDLTVALKLMLCLLPPVRLIALHYLEQTYRCSTFLGMAGVNMRLEAGAIR